MELQQSISLAHNQDLEGHAQGACGEHWRDRGRTRATSPVSVGRAYRHAPEVDGLVFIEGEQTVGAFVNATVYAGTEYDLWASVEPVSS